MQGNKILPQLFVTLVIFLMISSCKKKHHDNPPQKSSEKLITSFIFKTSDNSAVLLADVNGNIGSDTITVSLNQGINISSLIPTISYTGISLSPTSNVAQNFNNTINYLVTAEDGSVKKYTVKIVLITANQKVYFGSDDGNLYALNAHYGTLLWKYTTGGSIQSSPSLVNNTVYVGSNDKYLYAIDATTGTLKWKYLTAAPIRTESPVVSNGTVFISCANVFPDGYVYALDVITGVLKWSKSLSIPCSPAVSGGKVFVSRIDGVLYALDETNGNILWSTGVGLSRANPAINNGKLYIQGGGPSNFMLCADINTGSTIWQTTCSSGGSGPTINNGTVYVSSSGSIQQYLEAFDALTGILKWQYSPIAAGSSSSPTVSCPVAMNNLVYAGFHWGDFYALNTANGTLAWHFAGTGAGQIWFANPVAANAVLYVGSYENNVCAFDAITGTVKWKFPVGSPVYSGPCTIDSDGKVFHAGSSGSEN